MVLGRNKVCHIFSVFGGRFFENVHSWNLLDQPSNTELEQYDNVISDSDQISRIFTAILEVKSRTCLSLSA